MSEYIVYVREIVVHTVLVETDTFGAGFKAPRLAMDMVRTESPNVGITSRFEIAGMRAYHPHEDEDMQQYEFTHMRRYPIIR
jgi:hypothetical protein